MADPRVRDILDQSGWDAAVWGHPRGNIFCSWMWGEYKARLGWNVRRIVISDGAGDALAFIQYQEKAKGFARFVHVQGGPLLTGKGEKQAEAVVGLLLDHLALGRLDLLATDFRRFGSPAGVLALLAHGFVPVVSSRDHTLEIDLTAGAKAILQGMKRDWRENLRRAERAAALSIRFLADFDERLACFDAFSALYDDLRKRKGFDTNFNAKAYRDLVAADPHHLILEVRDNDTLVHVRIAHLSSERCTDFFAASTEQARVSKAPSIAVWRLVERAISEGCKTFDWGGIDPAGNRGVYDFKSGLSKNVVQSGPLWLYGRTQRLRDAAGAYLAFR